MVLLSRFLPSAMLVGALVNVGTGLAQSASSMRDGAPPSIAALSTVVCPPPNVGASAGPPSADGPPSCVTLVGVTAGAGARPEECTSKNCNGGPPPAPGTAAGFGGVNCPPPDDGQAPTDPTAQTGPNC